MASRRTGVDFSYLLGQAKIESSLNPSARAATSSATGLYQFVDQSWLAVVDKHGAEYGLGWAADAISKGSNGRYYVSDPDLRQQILDLRKHPETASVMAAAVGGFLLVNRAAITGVLAAIACGVIAHAGLAGTIAWLRGRK